MYKRYIKRLFDIAISLLVIIILLPAMAMIALIIKIDSKGPILFVQKRIGINKKEFCILKFRTMKTDTPHDVATHLLTNHNSFVTCPGEVLRKYSLDELPQLINILKGDMSAIGPRPALWNQFDLIEERDRYNANSVRPGLTGPAQICGIAEPPIPEKAKIDGEYIEKMSFLFDLKIAVKTMLSIIRR